MTIASRQPITLAVAQFEDIVSRGLQSLIDEDPNLRLVAADIDHERMSSTLDAHRPDVAILNFGSLTSPGELRDLAAEFPDTRLLVLANNPSAAECRQVIGFGATACLAKSTEARDVLHAIYLASRGLHVLPPAGMTALRALRAGAADAARGRRPGAAAGRAFQRRDRRRADDRHRDGAHPRAPHLSQARRQHPARAAPADLDDSPNCSAKTKSETRIA